MILFKHKFFIKNKIFIGFNFKEIFSQNISQKITQNELKNNSHNYLVLLPGNNCPNKNIRTLYFPRNSHIRKYDKPNYFVETNNSRIISFNYYHQTFYLEEKGEIRGYFLKKLGLVLRTMGLHSLYLTSYKINKKYENNIKDNIVNKYQKINRFFNYYDYVSKYLLYKNYKIMKDLFPYDYMLETYSNPEDNNTIYNKFKNYTLKNYSKMNYGLLNRN